MRSWACAGPSCPRGSPLPRRARSSSRASAAESPSLSGDSSPATHRHSPAPARYQQFLEIDSHLELVEIATVALILLVVGLTFRALGAALVTLFAAGIAFIVSSGVIPWVGERLGVTVPEEVEPLVVALTLGIVTDYAIFYLSGCRRSLFEGLDRVEAARAATIKVTPIVATAGLIVVAGTAALLVGELEFFRAFGPALALTAAISLVVSVTLVPALLALLAGGSSGPGSVRSNSAGRPRTTSRRPFAKPEPGS